LVKLIEKGKFSSFLSFFLSFLPFLFFFLFSKSAFPLRAQVHDLGGDVEYL